MPRRKRTLKKRIDTLTWEQEMNLIIGGKTLDELQRKGYGPQTWQTSDGVFENDQERRKAWETHCLEIETALRSGIKPQAWYDYEKK